MSQNPWCTESGESGTVQTSFEDNFTSESSTEKLPDSKEYLESLGE